MSIFLHIVFAIISLAVTAVTAFAPSRKRLIITGASIVLTAFSGVALAVLDHSVITHLCVTGLAYLSVEAAGVMYSVTRLRNAAKGAL